MKTSTNKSEIQIDFESFQIHFIAYKIKRVKPPLTDAIYKYKFYFCKEKLNNEILDIKSQSKLLILMQIDDSNSKYVAICTENTIIIVKEQDFGILDPFLQKIKGSTAYILGNNEDPIPEYLSKNEYFKILSVDNLFQEEINSLTNYLNILNTDIKKICNIFKDLISAYLIKKAHINSRKDRVANNSFYFSEKINQLDLEESDYVPLHYFNQFAQLIYDIKHEKLYVLKIPDNQSGILFNREYDNYLHIFHPLLPKFYGSTTFQKCEGLLIEYVEGHDLNYVIKMNLTIKEKLKIVFEIMIIIEYLHNKKYVYRDLKPNNLVFDEYKNIVLIDFDRMVKNDEQISRENYTSLFSNFVAPEHQSGEHFSYPADIYSFGKIVQFLFKNEFEQMKSNDNLYKRIYKLKILCEKCLEIDPKKRPNISQLIDDFFIDIYSLETNQQLSSQNIKNINKMHTDRYKEFWFLTAEIDNPECAFNLGYIYDEGKIVNKDDQMVFNCFQRAADKNHPGAQHNVGYMYQKGIGCSVDIEKAIEYYILAANNDIQVSQRALGHIYSFGPYKNINKSIQYYTMAAKKNNAIAQRCLGLNYLIDLQDINKGIYYLEQAAQQNDAVALYELGQLYFEGKYLERDIQKAIHYYSLSAKKDFPDSLYCLGNLYYKGKFVTQNIQKSIDYFSRAADQEYVDAYYTLGHIYYEGKNVPKNINKAIEYFTVAARNGHSTAQTRLGYLYYFGIDVARDIKKAIHYFTLAKNDSYANLILGEIYEKGIFVEQNISLAINYYKIAANLNDSIAQGKIGLFYYNGKYFAQNLDMAIFYFTLAASQSGYEYYYYFLGEIYFYDKNNDKKAVEYLLMAIKSKNVIFSQACYLLGYILLNSHYIPLDVDRAIYYYSLAADDGNLLALDALGMLYYEGKYVKQNIQKAIYYLTNAINNGNFIMSFYHLGEIYFEGLYVKQDLEKAIYYFTCSKEFEGSSFNLGEIFFYDIYEKKNINKAIYYYTLSANKNYYPALFRLAAIHEEGKYVKKDIKKAIYYYQLSANKGCEKAKFMLGLFYHQGKYFEKNISKAIHYYTDISSLNNQYAKNNLALIYKNGDGVKQDIVKAIELLKEAIRKNNELAMYNLAHIYLYGEGVSVNINEAISLLIKILQNKMTKPIDLLSLGLIKKYEYVKDENIIDELSANGIESNKLDSELLHKIKKSCHEKYEFYKDTYDFLKGVEYYWINYECGVPSKDFYQFEQTNENQKTKIKDINDCFYEGLGFDLLNILFK